MGNKIINGNLKVNGDVIINDKTLTAPTIYRVSNIRAISPEIISNLKISDIVYENSTNLTFFITYIGETDVTLATTDAGDILYVYYALGDGWEYSSDEQYNLSSITESLSSLSNTATVVSLAPSSLNNLGGYQSILESTKTGDILINPDDSKPFVARKTSNVLTFSCDGYTYKYEKSSPSSSWLFKNEFTSAVQLKKFKALDEETETSNYKTTIKTIENNENGVISTLVNGFTMNIFIKGLSSELVICPKYLRIYANKWIEQGTLYLDASSETITNKTGWFNTHVTGTEVLIQGGCLKLDVTFDAAYNYGDSASFTLEIDDSDFSNSFITTRSVPEAQ